MRRYRRSVHGGSALIAKDDLDGAPLLDVLPEFSRRERKERQQPGPVEDIVARIFKTTALTAEADETLVGGLVDRVEERDQGRYHPGRVADFENLALTDLFAVLPHDGQEVGGHPQVVRLGLQRRPVCVQSRLGCQRWLPIERLIGWHAPGKTSHVRESHEVRVSKERRIGGLDSPDVALVALRDTGNAHSLAGEEEKEAGGLPAFREGTVPLVQCQLQSLEAVGPGLDRNDGPQDFGTVGVDLVVSRDRVHHLHGSLVDASKRGLQRGQVDFEQDFGEDWKVKAIEPSKVLGGRKYTVSSIVEGAGRGVIAVAVAIPW